MSLVSRILCVLENVLLLVIRPRALLDKFDMIDIKKNNLKEKCTCTITRVFKIAKPNNRIVCTRYTLKKRNSFGCPYRDVRKDKVNWFGTK